MKTTIAVISESKIFGTCFAQCLRSLAPEFDVRTYHSPQDWLDDEAYLDGIVLLCASGRMATETYINRISHLASDARVIIMSDMEDPALKTSAMAHGAKGYVTMNTDLDVAMGAIKLVHAGGSFIPTDGAKLASPQPAEAKPAKSAYFTQRQLEVLKLTCQGNPNKIIAYKLQLSEATVKIHLRNMMRKLKARNRIELILKSNELRDLSWAS
ncbi:response regulator transcription factor [Methylovirgula sp. 4M-Z18]|uniref:response regulator transcription factor n=1 Tax=Methylovirgula sp. 4M-Z18 TaxID=2293567 RepID=UPI001314FA02|nr:response regulator transcription factor [Methylovirgula sp. 4M-Z18]